MPSTSGSQIMPSNRVKEGHGTDTAEPEAVQSVSPDADAIKLPPATATTTTTPQTTTPQDAPASTSESDSAPESAARPLKPKPKRRLRQRPKPEYLESLGIKIRDFAYENHGLAPIKTVFRHPVQIQPAVHRPIQRSSTEPDAGGSSQDSQGTRQPTEPGIQPAATEQVDDDEPSSQESAGTPIPEEILLSQAAGAIIDTPPVTPNGTLQWDAMLANLNLTAESQVAGPSRLPGTTTVPSSPSFRISTSMSALASLPSFYKSSQNVLATPMPTAESQAAGPSGLPGTTTVPNSPSFQMSALTPLPSFYNASQNGLATPMPTAKSQAVGPSRLPSTTTVPSSPSFQISTPMSALTPLPSFYNSSQNVLATPMPTFSRIQPARVEVRRNNSIQQLLAQSTVLLVAGGRYNLRKRPSPVPLVHKAKAAKRAKLNDELEPLARPFGHSMNGKKKVAGAGGHRRRNGEESRRRASKGKGKAVA